VNPSSPLRARTKNKAFSQEPSPHFDPETEIDTMIQKILALHDEIDKKLEDAYQKTGWTAAQIKRYLEDSSHFTPQQWDILQKQRKILLNDIWHRLGKNPVQMETKLKKEKETKSTKERKTKTIGARRNWIPLR
jgi:hypothetical protein